MGLKRHKDKSWKWVDTPCFAKEFHPESSNLPDCDGVMVLKDIVITPGSFNIFTEDGHRFPVHKDPTLEKIWVCSNPECGFIFLE